MPEVQTLAQKVRAKYPGAYDDLTDPQLEAKIRAKFPGVYDDLPSTPETAPATPQEPYLSAVAHRFVGGLKHVASDPAVGATVAALGAAPFTAGLSIPATMATVGAAGAAGAAPAAVAQGHPAEAVTQGVAQGLTEGAGALVTKGAQAVGTAVYRGYLKPALSMVDLPKAREVVATGIREMLPITKAGEARAKRLIGEINNQVTGLLSSAKGGRVDLRDIANKVRTFAQQKYGRAGVPEGDLAAALKVADDIDSHAALAGPNGTKVVKVNPSDANRVKQGLDTAIGDTAFGVERGAATEARKVGRHEARKAIERVAPEVGPLNAREAKIIDALEAVTKAAGREENRSALFGVPTLLSGAYGSATIAGGEDTTTAIAKALAARAILTPAVASRAAILAVKYAKGTGATLESALRVGVVQALRESDAQQPPQ